MSADSDGCTLVSVLPSLVTFCGDVEGRKIARLSAQSFLIEFAWCPHDRDAQCKAFTFRNPASDGAVAEVWFIQGGEIIHTARLAAAALAPSASTPCPPNRSCALVTPPSAPFDVISVRALSGIAVAP